MKRTLDEETQQYGCNNNNAKKSKLISSDLATAGSQFSCEICTSSFANAFNLKQHIESFHMKTSMWICSDCKKLFTSKSNLKVHLRVHTRIKPYHCKSCTYSCMHHSSIKEHLAKIHPGVIHSSSNPAYVFNSDVVPDPEQFNSADFNRAAFIAEAKEANDKLVAQISNTYGNQSSQYKSEQFTTNHYDMYNSNYLGSSSSVTISPVSNLSSLNSTRNDMVNQNDLSNTTMTSNSDDDLHVNNVSKEYEDDQDSSFKILSKDLAKNKRKGGNYNFQKRRRATQARHELSESLSENDNSYTQNNNNNVNKKSYTSFSISSIMSDQKTDNDESKSQQLNNLNTNASNLLLNNYNQYLTSLVYQNYANNVSSSIGNNNFPSNTWPLNNQLQIFYNLFNQLNRQQQQHQFLNVNNVNNRNLTTGQNLF